jgi:hypothetical protein
MSILRIHCSIQDAIRSCSDLRNIERLHPIPDCHMFHSQTVINVVCFSFRTNSRNMKVPFQYLNHLLKAALSDTPPKVTQDVFLRVS